MIQLFKLKFLTQNGFRIGGKVEQNLLTQLRIDEDTFIIPASSWKGTFRRVSEIVAGNKDHFDGHKNGNADEAKEFAKKDKVFRKIAESHEMIKIREDGEIEVNKENEENENEFVKLYKEFNCPIERLYGGEYFAGAITISDTVIKAEIDQRTHVTIDRKSRKGIENHLFSEEIVNVSSVEVFVVVRGEFELWKNTLKFLRDLGYFIGAGKSRGIGYIKLDEKESMFAEVDNLNKKPKFMSLVL